MGGNSEVRDRINSSVVSVIALEENANLREVCWHQAFLDKVKKEYQLTHGQAVLYVNVAQDRFRLVVCFYGMAMLLIPPITHSTKQLSMYLQVSLYLQKFHGFPELQKFLGQQVESSQEKIERRKKLAQRAKSKRTKKEAKGKQKPMKPKIAAMW